MKGALKHYNEREECMDEQETETGISRREFVKAGTLALVTGLTAANVLSTSTEADAAVPRKWDKTTEVIIVGAGGAGLAAAISAAKAGAKVLVVEKAPSLLVSSSAICGGGVSAAGTKMQKEKGQQDSKELFYEELVKAGGHRNDPELIKMFVDNAADTIDWFYDRGMKFFFRGYPGFSVNRQHSNISASGREYIDIMVKELEKYKVQILFDSPVARLVTNHETGEVLGVQAVQKGRKVYFKAKKAVILTSGGYAGSKDMIDRFLIPFKDAISCASPTASGDGLLMATKIGATTTHMGYGAVYAYGMITDAAKRKGVVHRAYEMAAAFGAITVNKDGKRFVREETTPTGVSLRLVDQPESTLYVIGDKSMLDGWLGSKMPGVIGWTHKMVEKEAREQKYFIASADTLEELAKKVGINPEGLKKTVQKYNGYVEAGVDPEFDRAKANLRKKLESGPFYALSGRPVALATTGGLKINNAFNVLDPYLVPVPRLYAAGEIIGGIHGQQYLGGCGFGSALTFGRLVGAQAAKEKSKA